MLHRFSRNELLVGQAGIEKLKNSSVAIVGLGGVGSYAAEAICRAGIGRITLVDFDDICLTNINRQLHALDGTVGRSKALDGTVGRSKVVVMTERLKLINPDAELLPFKEFYGADTSDLLLSSRFDYVLDAIDHITSKLHLIATCRQRGVPIVSSMGAAAKLDPTKITVADISRTHTCRMARAVRKLLKQRGISDGVKVVYSTEEYREPEETASACKGNCICPNKEDQLFSCEHRRVILGSSSFIPGIFGLTMAGVAIKDMMSCK
jgi:tRNA threonylcarbamoyladenosine dehydratase